jgi:hypothetical protein
LRPWFTVAAPAVLSLPYDPDSAQAIIARQMDLVDRERRAQEVWSQKPGMFFVVEAHKDHSQGRISVSCVPPDDFEVSFKKNILPTPEYIRHFDFPWPIALHLPSGHFYLFVPQGIEFDKRPNHRYDFSKDFLEKRIEIYSTMMAVLST